MEHVDAPLLSLVKSKVLFYSILQPVRECHFLSHFNKRAQRFHEKIFPILIFICTINSTTHYAVTVASVKAVLVVRNV